MAAISETLQPLTESQPLEFFMNEIKDDKLATWILDQVSILRSVHTITSYPWTDGPVKDKIKIGPYTCSFNRYDIDDFKVESDAAINLTMFSTCAQALYLKDGTVVIFLLQGDKIDVYHFQYEDSPDSEFDKLRHK